MTSISMEEQARKNREEFPICAAMVDSVRDVFGEGIKITYMEEGGRTIGRPAEERLCGTWVSLRDVVIAKKEKSS